MNNINIIVAAQVQDAVAGLNKVTQSTQRVQNQVDKASSTLKKHSNQYNSTAVATNKWAKGALQQAGYQVGDFAVQVSGGTSAIQAFGQQGSQLLGVFGPIGAVLGAVVAIASAVGVAFQKTAEAAAEARGEVKSFGEQMTDLDESMSTLNSTMLLSSGNIDAIKKKYGELTEDTREYLRLVRELATIDVIRETSDSFEALVNTKEYMKVVGELGGLKDDIVEAERALKAAIADELSADEITAFKENLEASEKQFAALNAELESMPEGKILALSEEFLSAASSKNVEAMKSSMIGIRQEVMNLPAVSRQALLPMVVQMEGKMREIAQSVSGTFNSATQDIINMANTASEVIFDPRDPRYNRIKAIMAQIQSETKVGTKSISEVSDKASSSVKNLAKVVKTSLSPELKRAVDLGNKFGGYFENSLMNATKGTQSFEDAFKSMASNIISELYRVFVVKRITGFISDAVSMAALPTGRDNTGTMGLPSFAGGGYTGSASRSGGLDGKGGFMAMLHPRETVVDHTKGDTGGGQVVVNQTINISTGVQQTVRSEIKTLMPQIADAAKSAVADAKRRGGSYGRAMA